MKIGFLSDTVLCDDMDIDWKIVEILQANNINCINLEAPFIGKRHKATLRPKPKIYNLSEDVEKLRYLNVGICCLANNHTYDYRKEGFNQTTKILKNNGIQYFGAGNSIIAASKPAIINDIDGRKYGIFGFCCSTTDSIDARDNRQGISPLYYNFIFSTLQQYSTLDKRILYLHFGTEYEDYPETIHVELYRRLAESGYVDVIIGTHPHCMQGFKVYTNNSFDIPAFFSLGNFIFPEGMYHQEVKFHTKSKFGYFVVWDTISCKADIIPYKISQAGRKISLLDGEEKCNFDRKLKGLSEPLGKKIEEYEAFYRLHRQNKIRPRITGNVKKDALTWRKRWIKIYIRYYLIYIIKSLLKVIKIDVIVISKIRKIRVSKMNKHN